MKTSNTCIQTEGYTEAELTNMKNRLLQKTSFREVFSDISFLAAWQQWVYAMWNYNDWKDREFPTLHDDYIMSTGLGGETGEVLEVLKKAERSRLFDDPKGDLKEFRENLKLELGDVLYYAVMIAARHNISLDEIIKGNVLKLESRREKKLTVKSKKSGKRKKKA